MQHCFFVCRIESEAQLPLVLRRAEALTRYWQPLVSERELRLKYRWLGRLRLVAGLIDLSPEGREEGALDTEHLLSWGQPPAMSVDLIHNGSDVALRAYDGVGFAFVAAEDRARLVVGTGDISALYGASGDGTQAWCSHAVGAAYLARGEVSLNDGAVAELAGLQFIGGDLTLVSGAHPIDSATVIDFSPEASTQRSYWSRADRWERVPEAEAERLAAEALLRSVERRVQRRPVWCGVTAGLDSPVVAVALHELGIEFTGLTIGSGEDADVVGGARICEALGTEHRQVGFDLPDERQMFRAIDLGARWSEGARRIPIFQSRGETPAGTTVTGTGGETGRAYWYGPRALDTGTPRRADLLGAVGHGRRLRDAEPAIVRQVDERVASWIADAEALGYDGFRALDVVYSEQRTRRFSRAHFEFGAGNYVPAFQAPDVQRALASLSAVDHAEGGFHRRFVTQRTAAIELPPPQTRRKGIPGPLRHLARRLRDMRSAKPAAVVPPDPPAIREWIVDQVLTDSPAVRALGRDWASSVRDRYSAGEADAVDIAHRVACLAAFEHLLHGSLMAKGSSARAGT